MKKILGCMLLLAFSVTTASAAGINLAWDNCLHGGGNLDKAFACNENTTTHHLYLSVVPPPGMDAWVAFEWIIELQSYSAVLPAWWQIRNAGSCRSTALSVSAVGPVAGCADVYGGSAIGGIGAYNIGFGAPNRARIKGVWALPVGTAALSPDLEYFVTRVSITSAKTVGLGSCAGCEIRVLINATLVRVAQPAGSPGGSVDVSIPAQSAHVYWQRFFTPTDRVTWGRIKSLYR